MARKTPGARPSRTSVKAPLLFSAALAVIAGGAVMIFATGGSVNEPRWDLALTAAGIVFIVALVIAAMLSMSEKPNAEHLGKGTGINRSSAKIPGGAANAHRPRNESPRFGDAGEAEPEPGSRAEHGSLERSTEVDGDGPAGGAHRPQN